MPLAAKPVQNTPRSSTKIGLLLGLVGIPIAIALLIPAATVLHQLGGGGGSQFPMRRHNR
jgi:hypothetical protein